MADNYAPLIDTSFLISLINSSEKVQIEGQITRGDTTLFIFKGKSKNLKNRKLIVRNTKYTGYDSAYYIAHRVGKEKELFEWYETNKNWKEGEYFVKKDN